MSDRRAAPAWVGWLHRRLRMLFLGMGVVLLAWMMGRSWLLDAAGARLGDEGEGSSLTSLFEVTPLGASPLVQMARPSQAGQDMFDMESLLGAMPQQGEADQEASQPEPESLSPGERLARSVRVEATMREAEPLAVINGRVCRVGDEVEGWRVAAIESRQVIFERGERRVALRIDPR